jgi:hypothetical protein
MRIVSLEATGVRGLTDGAWTIAADPSRPGGATVVTGPPQSGLTTFLDAIASSAARLTVGGPSPDTADVLHAGGKIAMIRTTWWLEPEERAFGGVLEETLDAEVVFQRDELGRVDADPALLGLMSRYDHSNEISKVVLLPARRVADGGAPMLSDFESDQRLSHLSPSVGKFAGLSGALVKHASGFGERARFEGVQRLFGALCATAQLSGVTPTGSLEFRLGSGARLPLHRLSLGERNAFVLAAMVVLLGLERSVILLDTPELGLAPGVAARWLEALSAATPEAQWIVASRDPAVVASAPPAARIALGRGAP